MTMLLLAFLMLADQYLEEVGRGVGAGGALWWGRMVDDIIWSLVIRAGSGSWLEYPWDIESVWVRREMLPCEIVTNWAVEL